MLPEAASVQPAGEHLDLRPAGHVFQIGEEQNAHGV
jgi:hypothetical protein